MITGTDGLLPALLEGRPLERGLAAELTDHLELREGRVGSSGASQHDEAGVRPRPSTSEVGPFETGGPQGQGGLVHPAAGSPRGQRRPGRPGFDDHQLVRRGHDGARIGHHLASTIGAASERGRSPKTTDAVRRSRPAMAAQAFGGLRVVNLFRPWSTPGAIRAHGPAPTTRAPRPRWLHRPRSSRGRAVEHAGHLGPSR